MINDKAGIVVKELFEPILFRYQIGWKNATKVSDFIFDCCDFLSYNFYKIISKRGGSYIDSPSRIKTKTTTVNATNKSDNKYFSIHSNTRIKSWKDQKKLRKNIES